MSAFGHEPFGDPYLIQSMAPGTVLRLSAVKDAGERELYRTTFATTLGVLNRNGDASMLGTAKTVSEALRDELALVAERYQRAVHWPRPGFEIGLHQDRTPRRGSTGRFDAQERAAHIAPE